MDAQLKAKWIEALRSGKYKQGRGKLRDGDSYCCLGVLYEVAGFQLSAGDCDVGYYDIIRSLFGYEIELEEFWSRNDDYERQCSFDEIADFAEEFVRTDPCSIISPLSE